MITKMFRVSLNTAGNLQFILFLSFFCLYFFCCSSIFSAEHDTVHLKVYSLPTPEQVDILSQSNMVVLETFKRYYPWINVSGFQGVAIQGLGGDAAPLMAIAGGISPDVIGVNFRQSDSYIQQGFLYPLDEWINEIPKEEMSERVLPSVRPVIHRVGPDGKKHWWAFPIKNSVMALYYRKDLFADAGLDPDRPPETWDEMISYARQITDPDKGIYGMGVNTGPFASWNFYSFLLSAGARAVSQNEKGEWRAVFNTPEAVEAVYFYSRFVQEKFEKGGRIIPGTAYRDVNLMQKWEQGKIGMYQMYLDVEFMSQYNMQLVGIAPVPKGPTGLRGSEINSTAMGMFAGIKDPKVREAAWEFIRFWGGPEAREIRVRVFVENGYGQFLNPEDLRKYGYSEYLKQMPKGWEKTFKEAIQNGIPEPYGKNCQIVYKYMTTPLDIAVKEGLGNKPPEVAKKRIQELLDEAVAETNEKMIGIIPPEKMALRRKVAVTVATTIVIVFCVVFWYLMKIFTPEGAKTSWGFKKYWVAYLILIPAVAGMLLWQYVPTVRGVIIAFMNYKIMGGSKFVGIDNFANVLFDKVFWQALWRSFYFVSLTIGLGFFAPIILALLLHEVPKGKIFFRVIFYLPAVISGLVVMLLWKGFYDPSAAGVLNKFLTIISGGKIIPQGWLTDTKWAMLCVVIPMVWASMGPACLIYLAALKTVPDDLYEAAEIDGSNTWQKLWNITIPTIKPLIIISFVGAVVAAFKTANFILAMTGGGPAGATQVLELEIFYNAFMYLKFGIATAMAWLLGFVLIGFTAYQMKRLSRMQFKAAE